MGREKRQKYTKEFKAEAVRLVEGEGQRTAEVARRLGINANMLNRWCRERERAERESADAAASDEEVRALRRRVRELEQEREILKKATAFFARESD
jgi:transposase